MGALISALADILSRIFSDTGIQTVVGSPNRMGELFKELIFAWLKEWRNQPNKSSYLKRAGHTSAVLRFFWPVVLYTGTLLVLGLVTLVCLAFSMNKHSWQRRVWLWICVASILVSAFPLISRVWLRKWPRLGVVLELVILGIVLMSFATRVLNLPALHPWALSAAFLILLLGAGGRSVEMLHGQTARDLRNEWKAPNPAVDGPTSGAVNAQLIAIRQYFSQELIIYSALPVGVLVGLFFFLLWGGSWAFTPLAIVSVCLRCVFGLAGLLLLYFLVASFRRMIQPTLCLASPPDLGTGTPAALESGCVMTAYRKMFLFDAMDNIVLLLRSVCWSGFCGAAVIFPCGTRNSSPSPS
jgi:hypothetical protein